MSEWADVLGSAVGGGVIAMLVWLGLKEPCATAAAGIPFECVKVGASQYNLAEVAFWVPLLCTGLAFIIHFARST